MNERIREIAKRADVLIDYGDDITVGRYSISGSTEMMEKFAELIVRECADIAWNNDDFLTEKIIKQHFGVNDAT